MAHIFVFNGAGEFLLQQVGRGRLRSPLADCTLALMQLRVVDLSVRFRPLSRQLSEDLTKCWHSGVSILTTSDDLVWFRRESDCNSRHPSLDIDHYNRYYEHANRTVLGDLVRTCQCGSALRRRVPDFASGAVDFVRSEYLEQKRQYDREKGSNEYHASRDPVDRYPVSIS